MTDVLDHPISADAPQAAFVDAVARAERGKERVLLMRDGRPVAALVPIEDVEYLEALEDAEDSRLAAEALAEYEQSGKDWPTYTLEELAARWGSDLADVTGA